MDVSRFYVHPWLEARPSECVRAFVEFAHEVLPMGYDRNDLRAWSRELGRVYQSVGIFYRDLAALRRRVRAEHLERSALGHYLEECENAANIFSPKD